MRGRTWLIAWALILLVTTGGVGAAGESSLIAAVKAGDVQGTRALLRRGVDVNASEHDGTTALHWAAYQNDAAIVEMLIAAGAKAGVVNRYGTTPLAMASVNGNAAIIERLVKAGANAKGASPSGETALMTGARTGNADALRVLLAYGADPNATESANGQTALMWAAASNNHAAIAMLVEAGADIHARSKGNRATPNAQAGFTALFYASRAGHIEAVKALLAAGARVDESLADGTTPLMLALANAHWELADLLVDLGADVNQSRAGWTPLHQLIITRRQPSYYIGTVGPTPTGRVNPVDLLKKLVARGADPNAAMTREMSTGIRTKLKRVGATPFLLAAKTCDHPQMRLLASLGADPMTTNSTGETPLSLAAGTALWTAGEDTGTPEECLEAVRLAVEFGNDVNSINSRGESPLHGAAYRGVTGIVTHLVEHGATLDPKTTRGWTPLAIANGLFYSNFFGDQPEVAALLKTLMTARGLSVEGHKIDQSQCYDECQVAVEPAAQVAAEAKKAETSGHGDSKPAPGAENKR